MNEVLRLLRSFGYALRGVGYGIWTQRNLRIHLVALAVVIGFNRIAGLSVTHWCIEILCCMLVLSLELVNTALEAACDRISTKHHALIGHAKDAAAGAVLVSAAGAVVIAVLLFFRGDESYRSNTAAWLQGTPWGNFALLAGVVMGLLFVFLPCFWQKQKKK